MRVFLKRWSTRLCVGVAALAASILLPAIIISADALLKRDPHATFLFAHQVAEAVALMAAAGMTFFGVRRLIDPGRSAPDEGAAVGAVSAFGIFIAANWAADVDGWTVASAALLPISGFLGGLTARRTERLRALHKSRLISAERRVWPPTGEVGPRPPSHALHCNPDVICSTGRFGPDTGEFLKPWPGQS